VTAATISAPWSCSSANPSPTPHDSINHRSVALWITATTDTDGQPLVHLDQVQLVTDPNAPITLPGAGSRDVAVDYYAGEQTTLRSRLTLPPYQARRLARGLDLAAFIATGGDLD
jgi:hypothetical protein